MAARVLAGLEPRLERLETALSGEVAAIRAQFDVQAGEVRALRQLLQARARPARLGLSLGVGLGWVWGGRVW